MMSTRSSLGITLNTDVNSTVRQDDENTSCWSLFMPVVLAGVSFVTTVVVWATVKVLLDLSQAPQGAQVKEVHDSLLLMRTLSPSMRWPMILLLGTLVSLALGAALCIWCLVRSPSSPQPPVWKTVGSQVTPNTTSNTLLVPPRTVGSRTLASHSRINKDRKIPRYISVNTNNDSIFG